MLAAANTISSYVAYPTSLTNTAIPGSSATRVPSDSVSPSVSNAQVDNNARGNSVAASSNDEPAATTQAAAAADSTSAAIYLENTGGNLPSSFIAQMIAQDESPETQGLLKQYEKLVAFGNVKYLPSDAEKPIADPSSVFGDIVQNSQQAANGQTGTDKPQTQTVATDTKNTAASDTADSQTQSTTTTTATNSAPTTPASNGPIILPQSLNAYIATSLRNNASTPGSVSNLF